MQLTSLNYSKKHKDYYQSIIKIRRLYDLYRYVNRSIKIYILNEVNGPIFVLLLVKEY